MILIGANSFIIILLLLLLAHIFPDFSLNQKEKNHLIGMSYMTMNNEYFRIISEEISNRVDIEGDQIILRDPALDSERQIKQINEMINQGVDALIINPVDWKALSSVLAEAKKQGIYIINVDSEVYDESLVDATIKSDNYQAGQIIGEYFLIKHPSARVVLMTHEVAKSSQDRIQGFLDKVSVNPNIEIVRRLDCQGQTEIAMPVLEEFLKEGISFDSMFCLNDLASLGAVAALERNGLLDQVSVYGVDATPDSKALIYEGMMKATAAQFPTKIGQMTSQVLYDLLNGKPVEKDIKIPVELINRDNVTTIGIDRWQ